MDEDCRFISTAVLVALTKTRNGTLDDLRTITMGCPACMLATIIQSGVGKIDPEDTGPPNEFQAWRYKDEKAQFWDDRKPCN